MQTDRDIQNLVDFVKFIEQNDLLGNDPILIAKQFIYPSAKFLALGKPEPLAKNKDEKEYCGSCNWELGIYTPHQCCNPKCDLWATPQ